MKLFENASRHYMYLEPFGCDLGSAMREMSKHFSSAKRKHLEKTNRREWGGKIYLNILAVAGVFWLCPKGWQLSEEGRAL